ncbi:hypothetical protein, partial [Gluconobacter kondonii]
EIMSQVNEILDYANDVSQPDTYLSMFVKHETNVFDPGLKLRRNNQAFLYIYWAFAIDVGKKLEMQKLL